MLFQELFVPLPQKVCDRTLFPHPHPLTSLIPLTILDFQNPFPLIISKIFFGVGMGISLDLPSSQALLPNQKREVNDFEKVLCFLNLPRSHFKGRSSCTPPWGRSVTRSLIKTTAWEANVSWNCTFLFGRGK